MHGILFESVNKTYPNGTQAVRNLNLDVRVGEYLVLVGPSGCGKSTTLRLIAGLEQPSSGRILFDGKDMSPVPPYRREVAMMFQDHVLYPHLSVCGNLAFPLRMQRRSRKEIVERVNEIAELLDLRTLLDNHSNELSGGQKQRVALGRALIQSPKILLLDEPLSNLDASLREEMRVQLKTLQRQLGVTVIHVTHDQEEAMAVADRLAVMQAGTLLQTDTPEMVYREPVCLGVARSIGSPPMNLIPCRIRSSNGVAYLISEIGIKPMKLEKERQAGAEQLLLGIRPHDILIVESPDADWSGEVQLVQSLGSRCIIYLGEMTGEDTSQLVVVSASQDRCIEAGDLLPLRLNRERIHLFDEESQQRLNVGKFA